MKHQNIGKTMKGHTHLQMWLAQDTCEKFKIPLRYTNLLIYLRTSYSY